MNKFLLLIATLSLFSLQSCDESSNNLSGSTSSDDDQNTITLKDGILNSGGVDTIYSIDTVFVVDTTSRLDSNTSSTVSSSSLFSSSSNLSSFTETKNSEYHWVSILDSVSEKGVYYDLAKRELSVLIPNSSNEIWTSSLPNDSIFNKSNFDLEIFEFLDLNSSEALEIPRNITEREFPQLLDLQVMFALSKNKTSIKLPTGKFNLSIRINTSKSLFIFGDTPSLTTIYLSESLELSKLCTWLFQDLTFEMLGDNSQILVEGLNINGIYQSTHLEFKNTDLIFSNYARYFIYVKNGGSIKFNTSNISTKGTVNDLYSYYLSINNNSKLGFYNVSWLRSTKVGLLNASQNSLVDMYNFKGSAENYFYDGIAINIDSRLVLNNSILSSKIYIYMILGETYTPINDVYTLESYNSGLLNHIAFSTNISSVNMRCIKSWNMNKELNNDC